jgi:Tol biopolymer transport system component
MDPISYLNRTARRYRRPLILKKENPSLASSPTFGVSTASVRAGASPRLPDTVNLAGQSIWKPSIAADGTIYFVSIDKKGGKRLFSSQYTNGAYQQAQPLPFSDGTTLDVDPEVAPDGSFLVFCSVGRLPGDSKDHLFIVLRKASGWGAVVPIRYAGDEKNGYSTDEPHLSPDHRTLYFSSDRAVPAHLLLFFYSVLFFEDLHHQLCLNQV